MRVRERVYVCFCMSVRLWVLAGVGARTSVSEGAHVCMRMGVHLRGRDAGAPA